MSAVLTEGSEIPKLRWEGNISLFSWVREALFSVPVEQRKSKDLSEGRQFKEYFQNHTWTGKRRKRKNCSTHAKKIGKCNIKQINLSESLVTKPVILNQMGSYSIYWREHKSPPVILLPLGSFLCFSQISGREENITVHTPHILWACWQKWLGAHLLKSTPLYRIFLYEYSM